MNDPLYVPERSMEPPEPQYTKEERYLIDRLHAAEQLLEKAEDQWEDILCWFADVPAGVFSVENNYRKLKTELTDYYNDEIGMLQDEIRRLKGWLGYCY